MPALDHDGVGAWLEHRGDARLQAARIVACDVQDPGAFDVAANIEPEVGVKVGVRGISRRYGGRRGGRDPLVTVSE